MNYEHVKEIASELKSLALRLDDALKENPNVYIHPWYDQNKEKIVKKQQQKHRETT